MQAAQADAVADLRATFPEHGVTVEERDDGSVWVTLHSLTIGVGWTRKTDDISTKLQTTFPDTEPYPFYANPGLQRTTGPQFSQIQPAQHLDGHPVAQISLRTSKSSLLEAEGLGARFHAVVHWLRSPR